jgi:hypothetical protein
MRALLCALLLVACASRDQIAPGAVRPPPDPVPSNLEPIVAGARDAFDAARAGDAESLARDTLMIRTQWAHLRPQTAAPAPLVATMDAAVARLGAATVTDRLLAARAATLVIAATADLYRRQAPVVPAELLDLDRLGRDLIVDGLANDQAGASRDAAWLAQVWESLRPRVLQAGGETEAAAYDGAVQRIAGAIAASDAVDLVVQADNSLRLIDSLEGRFVPARQAAR